MALLRSGGDALGCDRVDAILQQRLLDDLQRQWHEDMRHAGVVEDRGHEIKHHAPWLTVDDPGEWLEGVVEAHAQRCLQGISHGATPAAESRNHPISLTSRGWVPNAR